MRNTLQEHKKVAVVGNETGIGSWGENMRPLKIKDTKEFGCYSHNVIIESF